MGFARRIRRIVKGYMRTARERLDDLEAELARRELEESLEPGGTLKPAPEPTVRSEPVEETRTASTAPPRQVSDNLAPYYRLLGLSPGASLDELERVYETLSKRADPSRFAEGSEERRRAEQIRQRLQTAYRQIRRQIDPTYARFDQIDA